MSPSTTLLVIFLIWAAIGAVAAVVMGRRGHASFSWLVAGATLGPLVVPVALSRTRQARTLPPTKVDRTRRGPVDILVGIDGSRDSIAAANLVAGLVGERVGRLTLATVVDYDTALDGDKSHTHRTARAALARAAAAVKATVRRDIDTVVLAGIPADALTNHAVSARYDVIAVGNRGRGATKVVMGSVASRLTRSSPVPVLVAAADLPVRRELTPA